MQHHTGLGGPCDRVVVFPAHIGEHLADVLVHMQGGVIARVVGEHRDSEHAFSGGGEGDAVAGLDVACGGQVDHLLQAQRGRSWSRVHGAVVHVFGMVPGHRHRRVFHGPGHGLLAGRIEHACLLVGLRHVVPHRRREGVPHISVLLAPEAGPGHAAEQHHQQQ